MSERRATAHIRPWRFARGFDEPDAQFADADGAARFGSHTSGSM